MFAQQPVYLVFLYLAIAVLIRVWFRNRFTLALLVVVLVSCSALLYRDFHQELRNGWEQVRASVETRLGSSLSWPPEVGKRFPDLALFDQDGNLIRLSSLAGKVILVEPIGMSCPACVAFAGGKLYGAFEGIEPQPDLESIDEYLRRFGAVRLADERLVYVQLLLFNHSMGVPTETEARRWAAHFRLDRADRNYVLAGDASLLNDASRQVIPGFFLIDKDFVVRADSSGRQPKQDLYTQLIPMLHDLLDEVATEKAPKR